MWKVLVVGFFNGIYTMNKTEEITRKYLQMSQSSSFHITCIYLKNKNSVKYVKKEKGKNKYVHLKRKIFKKNSNIYFKFRKNSKNVFIKEKIHKKSKHGNFILKFKFHFRFEINLIL